MQNPRFTAAIQEMTQNPGEAMRKYQVGLDFLLRKISKIVQNDPHLAVMLKDFMAFMGNHFEEVSPCIIFGDEAYRNA